MWLGIKIAVLYGAPILAVVLAMAYFAVLLVRVRRGTLSRGKAAALYPITLLLPFAAVILVWGTAELASYFTVASDRFVWDASAAWEVLIGLLPIAAYAGAPIAVLAVAFWLTLALWKPQGAPLTAPSRRRP
jgi:hypothetical protein